jgi:hypothetical protein
MPPNGSSTNGDFELGNFSGWTKANYENLGLLGPCNGPFSGSIRCREEAISR